MPGPKKQNKGFKVLLTGGAGFLGCTMINELLKPDGIIPFRELRILDQNRGGIPDDERIMFIEGDVRDSRITDPATRDVDLVIHSAAIVDWGTKSKEEVLSVNYGGTSNMLESARRNGVKVFVLTSSLDVLFDGKPKRDVDENHPYPEKHSTSYCESKYLAEKEVIAANSPDFKTAVLRPADIYGEGDPYHIGSLIDMVKGGFYVRLGNGSAKSQHVYVGNIAHAHLQLSEALLNENIVAAGKCYFITDGPGSNFFTFFDSIVRASGYRIWPKDLWLPEGLAYTIGSLSELIAKMVRPLKYYNPKFSRFAVKYTCTDYTFNADRARKDFGFEPIYSEVEAFDRTVKYWASERASTGSGTAP